MFNVKRTAQQAMAKAAGFQEIYEKYSRSVYRFSLYLSGDAALAEDITSETFLRLWGSAEAIRMETVKGYLFAIARNQFLQEKRCTKRMSELSEDLPAALPAVRAMESQEELRNTLSALQRLSETDRTALLMRANDDLPYEEIARTLGITAAAAKVKVHRARIRLAEARAGARKGEGAVHERY